MIKKYISDLRKEFNGYDGKKLTADLMAGITVAAVALPLALSFGVSSGADAASGLITASGDMDYITLIERIYNISFGIKETVATLDNFDLICFEIHGQILIFPAMVVLRTVDARYLSVLPPKALIGTFIYETALQNEERIAVTCHMNRKKWITETLRLKFSNMI